MSVAARGGKGGRTWTKRRRKGKGAYRERGWGRGRGEEDRVSRCGERSGSKEKRHRRTATCLSRARIFQYRRWSATADAATERGNACDDVRSCTHVNVYIYFPLVPPHPCARPTLAYTRYIRLYTPVGVKVSEKVSVCEREKERETGGGGTVALCYSGFLCEGNGDEEGGETQSVSVLQYRGGKLRQNGKADMSTGNAGTCAGARRWGPRERTEPSAGDPAFSASRGEPTWAVPRDYWPSRGAGFVASVAPRGSRQ